MHIIALSYLFEMNHLMIYKSNHPKLKFPFYILNDNDYYLIK